MGWLSKVIQVIVKVAGIAAGIEPSIAQAVPEAGTKVHEVADDLTAVAVIVQNSSALIASMKANLTPEQEAQAVAPLIAQALLKSEVLMGKKVRDPAAFAAASGQLAGAIKGILEAVE